MWAREPHCNADTAEYLETAKCRVDPRFESPESEDSTQTCLYKKAGNKEISIKKISVEIVMDLLPLEVLNKIAKNRTLYVRAASTTVSVGWRGSCNKNWMWWQHYNADTAEYLEAAECRPHCNADTVEYLETAECRVDPGFESPESEDSTKTCLYKKARDKEISVNESLLVETGMDLLPLEALNIIAENQTLYVLAASSSCNADTAEYLETSECRVDPRFESPNSEDSTQTCFYKKAGYKEISIKKISVEIVMDYLPLEVLNKFAKNRTLYVRSASTTVSVGWRGSCNKNWMWWQHYNADTAEYLEAAECRVEPRFESQESEDSTLTCLYKRAGDKEISIKESLNRNGLTPNGSTKYNRRDSDNIPIISVYRYCGLERFLQPQPDVVATL
ncbi:hypothetical protein J6590_083214 [Homalodisca vitripennis]|nr:hypothetical protein J6590_083214 [Homalodisca vitripennis]